MMDQFINIYGKENFEHYAVCYSPLSSDSSLYTVQTHNTNTLNTSRNTPAFNYSCRRSWIAGGTHEADSVRTFLPGVGSLANYHPVNNNGKWNAFYATFCDMLLSTGSFSPCFQLSRAGFNTHLNLTASQTPRLAPTPTIITFPSLQRNVSMWVMKFSLDSVSWKEAIHNMQIFRHG